jgi:WD40 repeat protein
MGYLAIRSDVKRLKVIMFKSCVLVFTVLMIVALLPGCTNPQQQLVAVEATPTDTPFPSTNTPKPTSTVTDMPSPTPTLTASITPTPTNTPTITSSPTPDFPVLAGTPFPNPSAIISVENANQLRELADYTQKRTWVSVLSGNGKRLFFATNLGIDIYDVATAELISTIPAVSGDKDFFNYDGKRHERILPSFDGEKVVLSNNKRIYCHSITGELLWSLDLPKDYETTTERKKYIGYNFVFSPDLEMGVFPFRHDRKEGDHWTMSFDFEVWGLPENQIIFFDHGDRPVFSPDGNHLAIDSNGAVWIYDVVDWSKEKLVASRSELKMFLPDGNHMAFISETDIKIIRISDQKLVRYFSQFIPKYPRQIYFSADGQKAAWWGDRYPNPPLYIWDISDGSLFATLYGQGSSVSLWSAGLISLSDDSQFTENVLVENLDQLNAKVDDPRYLWYRTPTGFLQCILKHGQDTHCPEPINDVHFYANHGEVFSINDANDKGKIELYAGFDGNGNSIGSFTIPKDTWYGVESMTQDQRYVIFSTRNADPTVSLGLAKTTIWDLSENKILASWPGIHPTISFSPDEQNLAMMLKTFAGFSLNGLTIVNFDLATHRRGFQQNISVWSSSHPSGIALTPDGDIVYVDALSRSALRVKLIDGKMGRLKQEIIIDDFSFDRNDFEMVPAMAVSPDGKLLAIVLYGQIRLHDISTGEQIYSWSPHHAQAKSIVFSADGRLLATLSEDDRSVKVWGIWP